MESVSDAELKNMTQEERVTALGMRTEALSGKSLYICLLYTSPSPRDISGSRMPSSA